MLNWCHYGFGKLRSTVSAEGSSDGLCATVAQLNTYGINSSCWLACERHRARMYGQLDIPFLKKGFQMEKGQQEGWLFWKTEKRKEENIPPTCSSSPLPFPYLLTLCSKASFSVEPFNVTISKRPPNGRTDSKSSTVMLPGGKRFSSLLCLGFFCYWGEAGGCFFFLLFTELF